MGDPQGIVLTEQKPQFARTISKAKEHQLAQMQTIHPLRIALDVFIVILVGLPVVIFALAVTPYQRGFYCDDDTIRYPYRDSTVENITLFVCGLFIPVITILIVEAYRTYVFEPKHLNCKAEPSVCIRGKPCNVYLTRLYYYIGYFFFGAALCQTLTDIAKYTIGRLRPHFIEVCQPDWSKISCSNHSYIENAHCTGSQWFIREARLSFPSGHSSFGFFSMMYTVYYLQAQLGWPVASRLVKHALQFCLICIAFATALSRISDYKHHWSDVLSGSILGIVASTIVAIFIAGLFRYPKNTVYYHGLEATDLEQLQKMALGNRATTSQ